MMAGNFQHMGNAGGNPIMIQPPQTLNPNQNANQQLQMLLLQSIRAQSQQQRVGWRTAVADAERLNFCFQL